MLKLSAVYDKEFAYVFIMGLPTALSEFAQLLRNITGEATTYPLSDPPSRFLNEQFIVLKHLNLSSRMELLDIKCVEQTVLFAGDKPGLEFIADETSHLAENTDPDNYSHIHIDRWSDADKFTTGAIALIIGALEEDEI